MYQKSEKCQALAIYVLEGRRNWHKKREANGEKDWKRMEGEAEQALSAQLHERAVHIKRLSVKFNGSFAMD